MNGNTCCSGIYNWLFSDNLRTHSQSRQINSGTRDDGFYGQLLLYHIPVFEVDTNLKKLVPTHLEEILLHHLGKTAEIVVFLLGAMTIVEIIDYFNGFLTIKNFIKTKSKKIIVDFCNTCILSLSDY